MADTQSWFRPSEIPGVGRISSRVDRAIRWRIEEALGPVRDRLDAQDRGIRQIGRRLDERVPQATKKASMALTEVQRMQPQAASLEEQLEELRQRLDTPLDPGTAEEQAEARRLIDEVRDRLRKIEERLDALSGPGDDR